LVTSQGKVAVVIPTHNRRQTVSKAVGSVLRQTYCDLQCIVVDNGSTDGTSDALGMLSDPRLTIISEPRPLGPSLARNVGVSANSGAKWLTFLDSDDYWAPDKVEQQINALARYPAAQWCATSGVSVGTGIDVRFATRLCWGQPATADCLLVPQEEMLNLLKDDNMIPAGGSNVLVSRELYEAVGGFDAELFTNEDWDLWLKLAKESPLAYVDAPLVGYRVWDGQASNGQRFLDTAALVRFRHLSDAGPLPREYGLRWELEVARRHVAAARRIPAARSYLRAAVIGRAPGQLAYAAAAAAFPRLAEWRLRRIESTRSLPEGWQEQVEPWLDCWRSA
jgi:glycosyltransferase involved in cell wall biosynthesis